MKQYEIAIWRDRVGGWSGIGTLGAPTKQALMASFGSLSFVRDDVRITVVFCDQGATVEVARQFAISLYESRSVKIDLDTLKSIDRLTSLRGREFATP